LGTTSDPSEGPAADGSGLAGKQQDRLLDVSGTLYGTGWRIIGSLYTVVATLWVILAVIIHYLVLGIDDVERKWSYFLPDLGATPSRTACMGLHFLAGSVIMLLGVWQVCPCSRRQSCLRLHHIGGRVYVACSVATAVGGFGFILEQCVLAGGWTMTVSFCLYGGCVVAFALMAYWKARKGDIGSHRRWALRSFAMATASFSYRVWLTIGVKWQLVSNPSDSYVPNPDRSVPFFCDEVYNQISQWGFFVLNWLVVEWLIQAPATKFQRILLALLFFVVLAFLGVFAFYFTEAAAVEFVRLQQAL